MGIEAKVLGQQVAYPTDYCPLILVPVPRSLNRVIYDIHLPEELFRGYDTWHAYEAGFLTQKGLPVCGVESKSLKLYLNSLNMTRLGENMAEGIDLFTRIVKSDLEQILDTRVDISFFQQEPEELFFDFNGYALLENDKNAEDLSFTEYDETPALR